jgi:molybdopterin-guanine dinucleotide biosynthesis protein A
MSASTERDKPIPLTVLLPRDLRDRLEAAAQENDRSAGGEVRAALRVYLEANDDEPGAA